MARSLFGQTTPVSLADISAQDISAKIIDRARRAGIASSVAPMATGFGNREIRVTAKPITLPDGSNGSFSACAASGSSTVKVEPWPSLLLSEIRLS